MANPPNLQMMFPLACPFMRWFPIIMFDYRRVVHPPWYIFCWQRLMKEDPGCPSTMKSKLFNYTPIMGYNMFISSHSPCIYIWYVYTPPIYMSLSNHVFFRAVLVAGTVFLDATWATFRESISWMSRTQPNRKWWTSVFTILSWYFIYGFYPQQQMQPGCMSK